ncbi:GNAT family N-acetyltransferase [Cellvibrio sp. QJXJ]|uniref:GNAT family N-acetyltransferase n=1 Tax=Cellvibrio sp. QJXJ TaxID=2964606 RepID=UPI0021C2B12A|nr:GNAT family N-acetyltransferase [Cellvibrio sp. QJXJ]UUA72550.1 GNAT family N-acetyltransferase [Cellvibrio sp. QJXJ]
MEIIEAKLSDLPPFFEYLAIQLFDNAADNSPLFQPIAKEHCQVSDLLKAKFQNGFEFTTGNPDWRKLWLAKNRDDQILGHIDLRHYNDEYRFHRVLLGMGVHHAARKQGIGLKLLETVILFCRESSSIEWLDLNVLSNNLPAKKLYLKCGFTIIGEMTDCYRIDGKLIAETTMTLNTKIFTPLTAH